MKLPLPIKVLLIAIIVFVPAYAVYAWLYSPQTNTEYLFQGAKIRDIELNLVSTGQLEPKRYVEVGAEQRVRIPMLPDSRSMNLSNAVSVFVYESWRQFGYEGAR